MIDGSGTRALAEFTTLEVGGPARELVDARSADELEAAALEAWDAGEDVLVLGGGSNVLVGDDGFDGRVIRVLTRGVDEVPGAPEGFVRLSVQAGEPWDDLVALTVAHGLAGFEALSGIPGSTGAGPIQNIGAYGAELSDTLVAVSFLDYDLRETVRIEATELELGYRTSSIKQGRAGVITAVEFDLARGGGAASGDSAAGADSLSSPIAFEQLATALGVSLGSRVPLGQVRESVLALRRAKGMVLDPADRDTASAGSFFTNPIVRVSFAASLPSGVPRWPVGDELVKLSAAWLIERAGIRRGFSLPGSLAAISSKHSLAITNRGGATATEIASLARFVQERVRNEFGVALQPEPVYVGVE